MEWSDLRIFLAIARAGTLGGAARVLGLSQPTMGRRLRALELELGCSLFQRTADGLVLTDEGTTVLEHAERMEEESLAFQRRLAGADVQLDGMLRVSSSDWFGTCMLAPVLAEFSQRHPKVCVELVSDARMYSLPRREADIAFRIQPFQEPEVVSRRLMHIPYAVYARADRAIAPTDEGADARVITMDTAFGNMPDVLWLTQVWPKARVAMRSNSRLAQAEFCRQGAGLAVLPIPLGDRVPGLARVETGLAPPGRDTYLGYHRDLRRLSRLRALLDLVIERLAN
ncbi:LysR family transcriptional regulator [Bordetella genomosp. 11]|uniref:LysR family transcriptional regulator n=1 Tax=Bordetella genomosp. 11 TaxID=1416808 RepID=A0A261UFF3_9BORD|nr:LysR family transcriptional regulator [Bordetella genomosp. 11]OZI60666.1 LysR family transcriptional regulator [Bordetella genomosp. 11]